MSMLYLVALYCLATPKPNIYLREPPKIEAPACMEHREEFAGTLQECSTRGVTASRVRLAALYQSPIVLQAIYCREARR